MNRRITKALRLFPMLFTSGKKLALAAVCVVLLMTSTVLAQDAPKEELKPQDSSQERPLSKGPLEMMRPTAQTDFTITDDEIVFTSPGFSEYLRAIRLSDNLGYLSIFSTDLSGSPGAAIHMAGNGTSLPGQMYFDSGAHNNAALIFRTAPTGGVITERMRITASGNVGIGTTGPISAKLHVENDSADGVIGQSNFGGIGVIGSGGTGVSGSSNALGPSGIGVRGEALAGPGVRGISSVGAGVEGVAMASNGTGGHFQNSGGGDLIRGQNSGGTVFRVANNGDVFVRGQPIGSGSGLTTVTHDATLTGSGTSISPLGVAVPLELIRLSTGPPFDAVITGRASIYTGVMGRSVDGIGVHGTSGASTGVRGVSGGFAGVAGINDNGYGVYAAAPRFLSWAGHFDGDVRIIGTLTKSGGSFKIDHPLDPENKYLSHSFVESPDMLNIYNGNITTDADGDATVTLPHYFVALNRDYRYQLTVIGQFAQAIVASEIEDNRFTIKTDKPNVKVSWQVTGIRQDKWANAYRIPVEEDKTAKERGFYLHPEVFGQPEEKSIGWAVHPQQMRRIKQELEEVRQSAAPQP